MDCFLALAYFPVPVRTIKMGSNINNSLTPRMGSFSRARATSPKMWRTQSTCGDLSLILYNLDLFWTSLLRGNKILNGDLDMMWELKLAKIVWLKNSFPAPMYVSFLLILSCLVKTVWGWSGTMEYFLIW